MGGQIAGGAAAVPGVGHLADVVAGDKFAALLGHVQVVDEVIAGNICSRSYATAVADVDSAACRHRALLSTG